MTETVSKSGTSEKWDQAPSSRVGEPVPMEEGVKPLERALVFVVRDLLEGTTVEEVVTLACLRADQVDLYVGRSVFVAPRKYRRARLEEALDYARLFEVKAMIIPNLDHIAELIGVVTLVCDLIVLDPPNRYRKTAPVVWRPVREDGVR